MTPVTWAFGSYMLAYWLAYLVVIGGIIVALGIERALTQRPMPRGGIT